MMKVMMSVVKKLDCRRTSCFFLLHSIKSLTETVKHTNSRGSMYSWLQCLSCVIFVFGGIHRPHFRVHCRQLIRFCKISHDGALGVCVRSIVALGICVRSAVSPVIAGQLGNWEGVGRGLTDCCYDTVS